MEIRDRIVYEKRNKTKEDWYKPKIGVYHASGIYNICEGNVKPEDFFKEEELSDSTIRIFDIGNMYHKRIQELYSEDPQEKPISIKIDDFKIIGRVDLLRNGKIPCELKTCSILPEKEKIEHKYQLMCYLKGLNEDSGYITYIEKHKTDYPTKNIKVDFSQELWDSIIKKVRLFHNSLKEYEIYEKKKNKENI